MWCCRTDRESPVTRIYNNAAVGGGDGARRRTVARAAACQVRAVDDGDCAAVRRRRRVALLALLLLAGAVLDGGGCDALLVRVDRGHHWQLVAPLVESAADCALYGDSGVAELRFHAVAARSTGADDSGGGWTTCWTCWARWRRQPVAGGGWLAVEAMRRTAAHGSPAHGPIATALCAAPEVGFGTLVCDRRVGAARTAPLRALYAAICRYRAVCGSSCGGGQCALLHCDGDRIDLKRPERLFAPMLGASCHEHALAFALAISSTKLISYARFTLFAWRARAIWLAALFFAAAGVTVLRFGQPWWHLLIALALAFVVDLELLMRSSHMVHEAALRELRSATHDSDLECSPAAGARRGRAQVRQGASWHTPAR